MQAAKIIGAPKSSALQFSRFSPVIWTENLSVRYYEATDLINNFQRYLHSSQGLVNPKASQEVVLHH